ncbi:unnamed protein product, partial [Polarella glacialis]
PRPCCLARGPRGCARGRGSERPGAVARGRGPEGRARGGDACRASERPGPPVRGRGPAQGLRRRPGGCPAERRQPALRCAGVEAHGSQRAEASPSLAGLAQISPPWAALLSY